ncbi:MAG: hypothetical protein P1V81_17825 [Planctomycetota bacterium]|nr:hypothetical protein [Planctomycetota bacterium]
MSDHNHAGPPAGEALRWLDHPENIKRLTKGFFALCALTFLLDVAFFFVHKHNSFESKISEPEGLVQSAESWFGFYSLYGFVAIVLLVVLSVGLRKLVMRPEDYYSRDYDEPAEGTDDQEAHHG